MTETKEGPPPGIAELTMEVVMCLLLIGFTGVVLVLGVSCLIKGDAMAKSFGVLLVVTAFVLFWLGGRWLRRSCKALTDFKSAALRSER